MLVLARQIILTTVPYLHPGDKSLNNQEDSPPPGYRPFRRGSMMDMISAITSLTGGSSNEGCATDGSGHLTTNTSIDQPITVPMPKSPQNFCRSPISNNQNFSTDHHMNRNIPSLTLSYSDGSLNDHHLAFCLFEVCLGLREFSIQKGNLPVKERRKNPNLPMSLTNYHEWFLPGFTIWINVTAKQVHCQIIIENY